MKKLFQRGDVYVWFSGVALMFSLLMIAALLLLITTKGLAFFWPSDIGQYTTQDGSTYLGQFKGDEKIPDYTKNTRKENLLTRTRLRIGNRDIYGLDFRWVDNRNIEKITYPKDAIILERREWGNFHGYLSSVNVNGKIINSDSTDAYKIFRKLINNSNKIYKKIKAIEKGEIGKINYAIEKLRLEEKGLKLDGVTNQNKYREIEQKVSSEEAKYKVKEQELTKLYNQVNESKVVMYTPEGREKVIPIGDIVRAYKPNNMSFFDKLGFYFSKIWEFVSENPREANTEGGIFPAIFGTIMMVLIMSIAVMPFGVLAALYLREYAKQGPIVRIIRICVNNLAGVPSIVYGVFGVGFFLYGVGGLIDAVFFREALPNPTYGTGGILWASLTLALLTVPVVIVATEEGLAAVPKNIKDGSLALGATKFETIWKVIIPSATPAILTGLILAIARATGEVAPLMITGVVKLAPDLPIDGIFPFLHLERKFMHLGFHIYDVGFQSPNVEAAKPMVFTTAFLLILIVIALNLTAIVVRNKLKKKYATSAV